MNQLPGGIPSIFAPRGIAARHLATLGWVTIIIALIVLALVLIALLVPLARTRSAPADAGVAFNAREHMFVLVVGAAIPALILLGVYLFSMKDIGIWNAGSNTTADVEVIGHQWWWEVRYPKLGIQTANEIYIPAGTRVTFALMSSDVIHSFWVPQLHGKLDMIPGRVNRFWLEADSAGQYRGECAEYCGTEHARMDFTVVAVPRAEFSRWASAQAQPAKAPGDPAALEGRRAFQSAGCAFCHTVNGNGAGGRVGPDLTHFASRLTIGAGMLPNTRGFLAGWVVGAQHLKPGIQMPDVTLSGEELQAVLAYLEGLR
ncbi:MAG TPA: cytochrome c oxidase subunit II [Gemmatimonadaceae bacterium]|jgi:cytochrome c oxidase subunit 2